MKSHSAFTLIELLVVIAIIAVLAVVVVITLNPAQLLAQARDSNRVSDMATLNSAINLYSVDQAGTGSFSLGTSSVTYISIPDPTATTTAGTNCSGLGGNFATGTTFLDCAASTTYRLVNGQGWVPVNFSTVSAGSPFGALPVDPVNSTSSNEYYTYQTNGNTYRIVALPESQKYAAQVGTNPTMFIAGSNANLYGSWVLVPGNPTFGTGNFYVMKYTAVCTDGKGNVLNDSDTGTHSYDNTGKPCTAANGRSIASLPGGWQIANIFQPTAVSYCQAIGAHLMTNNEWQTIAWNVENVATNWSGGTVGSGYMYSGKNDSTQLFMSPASADDSQGYFGTSAAANQKRTLTLSNGSIIWDMAGNIWQWVSDTIVGTNEPHGLAAGWNWLDFTSITTWGSMTRQAMGPSNAAWVSAQGMGTLGSNNMGVDTTVYGIGRGGSYNNIGNAGIEASILAYPTNTALNITGFRCVR